MSGMFNQEDLRGPIVYAKEEGDRISTPDNMDIFEALEEKGKKLNLGPEVMEEIIYGEQFPETGLNEGQLEAKREALQDTQYDFLDGKVVAPMYEESMHQDVGEIERLALTKFGDLETDKKGAIDYLRKTLPEDTHDIISQGDRYFIKKKKESTYKVLDPQLIGLGQIFQEEELLNAPVGEVAKETARETFEGGVSLLKELAPRAAGVLGGLAGAAAGPLAFLGVPGLASGAAGLTASIIEASRQAVGKKIGVRSKDLEFDKIIQEGIFEGVSTLAMGGDIAFDTAKRFHSKKLLKNFSSIVADQTNLKKVKAAKNFVQFYPKKVAADLSNQATTAGFRGLKRLPIGGVAIREAAEKTMTQQKGLVQRGIYGVGRLLASAQEKGAGNPKGAISNYAKNLGTMIKIADGPTAHAGAVMRKMKDYSDDSRRVIGETKDALLHDAGDKYLDSKAYTDKWDSLLAEQEKEAKITIGAATGSETEVQAIMEHQQESLDRFTKLHRKATTFQPPEVPAVPRRPEMVEGFDGEMIPTGKMIGGKAAYTPERIPMPAVIKVKEFQNYLDAIDPAKTFNKESLIGLSPQEAEELIARKDLYFTLKNEMLYKPEYKNAQGVTIGINQDEVNGLRELDEYYKDALEMDIAFKAMPYDKNKRSEAFNKKAYEILATAGDEFTAKLAKIDEHRFLMPVDGKYAKHKLNIMDKGFADHQFDIQTYDKVGDIRPRRQGTVEDMRLADKEISPGTKQTVAGGASIVAGIPYGATRAGVSAAAGKLSTKRITKQVAGHGVLGSLARIPIAGYKGIMDIPGTVASNVSQKVGKLPGLGLFKIFGADGNVAVGKLGQVPAIIPVSKAQMQDAGRATLRNTLLRDRNKKDPEGIYAKEKALQEASAWEDAR